MKILGISAYFHDSAASLIVDGEIIAAVQEERFTRVKNDSGFPINAIQYCLVEANIEVKDLDAIVFYEKPFLKFERILIEFIQSAPFSLFSFVKGIPNWLKHKLVVKKDIRRKLNTICKNVDWSQTKVLFSKHHLSHAASSFFVSPFDEAVVLTIDGVGEYDTASIALGRQNTIETLKVLKYPHSIGLFYSAFTAFLGFEVNNGEYKVMGLAPYGTNKKEAVSKLIALIKQEFIAIHESGAIKLNEYYFSLSSSKSMLHLKRSEAILNLRLRLPSEEITEKHILLAAAVQQITEEVVIKMVKYAKSIAPSDNLCLAGGVALNCVANGKIQESGIFKHIYIQPASGDAGGSLGAALAAYYMHFNNSRLAIEDGQMKGAGFGPSFDDEHVEARMLSKKYNFVKLTDAQKVTFAVDCLLNDKIIGWFQGRMEFGPRALGNRSIIANPLHADTQSRLNLKVKKRESFRPFAPILLLDEFDKYFGQQYESNYMLFAHRIKDEFRKKFSLSSDLIESINQNRSPFPAATHVDYSSRIQTVTKESNSLIYSLLTQFKAQTGYGLLVNTSFNIKDEPIVCSPEDAFKCFETTDIDVLIINNYIIQK
jgi:carbamoyltransferase